jgi:hypothetical protein
VIVLGAGKVIGDARLNGHVLLPSWLIVHPFDGMPCHSTGSPGSPEKLPHMLGVRVVRTGDFVCVIAFTPQLNYQAMVRPSRLAGFFRT